MKNKVCCFTGHRKIAEEEIPMLKKRLEEEVIKLVHQGVFCFGAGGALGFDTLAALTVLKTKEAYPKIRLILVLPCQEQTKMWCEKDIYTYQKILSRADKIVYTSEHYFSGCMQKRNRHLVNCSSICLCYLTRNIGGTAYTVNYAKSKGLTVINISKP